MINNQPPATTYVRSRRPQGGLPYLKFDVILALTVFTLVIFGTVMVYSASWDFSFLIYDDPSHMFNRQLIWLGLGLVAVVVTTLLDYHHYRRFVVPGMAVVLVGLLLVLIRSEVRLGAARTLSEGSYMPSEAAKIITIIYLAVWLYAKRNFINDINFGLIPLGAILGVVSGFILAQPDLSAAATILFLGGLLFFLAGADLKQIAFLMILAVIVGWIVVQIHPTGSIRVANYLNGIRDPLNASYHVQRSYGAFLEGGLFGVGIGKSTAKLTGLPVPPTDSIFAVVAEETGLLGSTILISLFMIMIWRGMVIAQRAPDMLGSLLASGMTIWLGIEALINMAVMVGLVPFAGNALPFISYGGSNLLVSLAAIGILLNISRAGQASPIPAERTPNEINRLRRRQRRRDQPRPGRAPGAEFRR